MAPRSSWCRRWPRAAGCPSCNFAAGGIATPADAALMMQLGADGVFVGSGIFKSGDPARARQGHRQGHHALQGCQDHRRGLAGPGRGHARDRDQRHPRAGDRWRSAAGSTLRRFRFPVTPAIPGAHPSRDCRRPTVIPSAAEEPPRPPPQPHLASAPPRPNRPAGRAVIAGVHFSRAPNLQPPRARRAPNLRPPCPALSFRAQCRRGPAGSWAAHSSACSPASARPETHRRNASCVRPDQPAGTGRPTGPAAESPHAPPLDGTRVLDLTVYQHGPYASTILANLGADVVQDRGAGSPAIPAVMPGTSNETRSQQLLRGAQPRQALKICLDLKHSEGREVFLRLAIDR